MSQQFIQHLFDAASNIKATKELLTSTEQKVMAVIQAMNQQLMELKAKEKQQVGSTIKEEEPTEEAPKA